MRLAGHVPVEAGIVDQHHRVGSLALEVLVGLAQVAKELGQVQQHAAKPHDGQLCEVLVQVAPRGRHSWATKTNALDARLTLGERPNQVRAVQVAARFANGEEYFHQSIHATRGRPADPAGGRRSREVSQIRQTGQTAIRLGYFRASCRMLDSPCRGSAMRNVCQNAANSAMKPRMKTGR